VFTEAVSKSDYLASNDWMTQNNEVEMILEGSRRGPVGERFPVIRLDDSSKLLTRQATYREWAK
jgi:hypothetical protein